MLCICKDGMLLKRVGSSWIISLDEEGAGTPEECLYIEE